MPRLAPGGSSGVLTGALRRAQASTTFNGNGILLICQGLARKQTSFGLLNRPHIGVFWMSKAT